MEQMEVKRCLHKWRIIRAEEGQRDTLMNLLGVRSADVMIYHIQCEKCGLLTDRVLTLAQRNYPYKILKEIKWPR
jgi:hypothetical protein